MATSPAHTGNVGNVRPGYHPAPRVQRSFTIPHHRPNMMYVPTTPATQGVPTIQHFNSRGELIHHRRISPTVIDLRVCSFLDCIIPVFIYIFEEITINNAGAASTARSIASSRTGLLAMRHIFCLNGSTRSVSQVST